ncbi:Uncharacterized protein FWK35_00025389 [Aphis craccivora]|uniref:Uncharacterized protein n=1 Tax=Aphis craccivora TaxID=307492 RepID=A0A6G0YKG4_APHCR|nr:Uncharacterized protein FWK35_00025389 [Aphis craccivora]
MNANYKPFDRDGRKKNLREGLPAYAYSRGVELRSDKNPYLYMQSEVYDPRRNVLNISYPINVPEFELPNEEQISYYEQLMMMSNETIVLNNFLDEKGTLVYPKVIPKKPDSVQELSLKKSTLNKCSSEILPFYKICFEIMKVPTKDTKWKLCLITEHSTELRSEIQQIYLHMWLYYKLYMEKVDLGVLDTCNRIMGFGQSVTETERIYLTIRDDYLMATQILVLLKCILSNQHISIFKEIMETLELWKTLLQKMSTNPKMYELSSYNTTSEMAELLELLTRSYFKTRHYLEACFVLMVNKEDTIKEQRVKDDMLCKYWYLMVDTPEHKL